MIRPRPAAAAESSSAAGGVRSTPQGARLAHNQLRRMRRIVDAAIDLAEKGGFEAVRLRDVAEQSDVALGTLYKYFRSKEDILLFALNEEIERLEHGMVTRPSTTGTAYLRIGEFFRRATRALARRPQFARAMIRSMTAGDADTAVKIAALQLRIARVVTAALRGVAPTSTRPWTSPWRRAEQAIAFTIMQVWFSSLVGWAAGLHPERVVSEQVRRAAGLILDRPGAE
jgi:AcrR family transcriptional regulator